MTVEKQSLSDFTVRSRARFYFCFEGTQTSTDSSKAGTLGQRLQVTNPNFLCSKHGRPDSWAGQLCLRKPPMRSALTLFVKINS